MIKIEIGTLVIKSDAQLQSVEISQSSVTLEKLRTEIMRLKIILSLAAIANYALTIYGNAKNEFGINVVAYDVTDTHIDWLVNTAKSVLEYDALDVRANYKKLVG